jgi:ParB family chromosome partitioning protein
MDAIEKNLSPEFKEEFKGGGINMSTAYELSGLPEEKQKEAHREYQEKGGLSINDVKQKKAALQNTRPAKPAKPPEQPQEGSRSSKKTAIPEIKLNRAIAIAKPASQKPAAAEEPNKETVFDAMRKMDLNNWRTSWQKK